MMRERPLEVPSLAETTEGSSDVFEETSPIKNVSQHPVELNNAYLYLFIYVIVDLRPQLLTDKITNRIK